MSAAAADVGHESRHASEASRCGRGDARALLLIQPELDADVSPGYALGQALQHAGKTYGLLIILADS